MSGIYGRQYLCCRTKTEEADDGKLHVRFNFLGPHNVEIKERKIYEQDLKHEKYCCIANYIKYSVKAGLNLHITPHKCRSTYATNLYEQTSDLYLVRDALHRIRRSFGIGIAEKSAPARR